MPPPFALTGVSYFGNRNPLHFARDLQEMKARGCNAVLHTFSENDQLFYKRTLKEFVHMSREEGLTVGLDPWGVGRVFSGESTSEFAFRNRSICQVFRNGHTAPAACVNHPKFVAFMEHWIADAAELAPDFLFWDEPRFHIEWDHPANPEIQVCWCQHCRIRFAAEAAADFPIEHNATLLAFKTRSLLGFISHLCRQAKGAGLRNTLCLLPTELERTGAGNWEAYASIPELDVVGTSPYWRAYDLPVLPYVADQSARIADLARRFGKQPEIWIQAYRIPAGSEGEITTAARAITASGITNVWAWSFRGTPYMSYIACGNPPLVWEKLGEAFTEIQQFAANRS